MISNQGVYQGVNLVSTNPSKIKPKLMLNWNFARPSAQLGSHLTSILKIKSGSKSGSQGVNYNSKYFGQKFKTLKDQSELLATPFSLIYSLI
jgi:hypothetical protein